MRTTADRLELVRPRSLAEALDRLAEAAAQGRPLTPLAGGTDLMVALDAGLLRERRFLDVWGLRRLRYLDGDRRTLRIGALSTWTDCVRSRDVQKRLPILAAAGREVGGAQIQNRGTLAGNVGNGSPAGDSLPILAACDTQVVLMSAEGGRREVPFGDFYTGYRATVRRPDELIVELRVEVPEGEQRFRKVGTRAAQAISKVVMAAVGHRVALGSVGPTVIRARGVEAWLDGGGRDPEEGRARLLEEIRPIDDVRSTAEYRRQVAGNVLAAWLRDGLAPLAAVQQRRKAAAR